MTASLDMRNAPLRAGRASVVLHGYARPVATDTVQRGGGRPVRAPSGCSRWCSQGRPTQRESSPYGCAPLMEWHAPSPGPGVGAIYDWRVPHRSFKVAVAVDSEGYTGVLGPAAAPRSRIRGPRLDPMTGRQSSLGCSLAAGARGSKVRSVTGGFGSEGARRGRYCPPLHPAS
jgi:hypothetical protein